MLRILPLALVLAWDGSPGATGYRVFYGNISGVYMNVVDVATASVQLPIQSGFIAVVATNQWGRSAFSAELYVPPPQLPITTIIEKADFVNGPWTAVATFSNSFQIKTQQFFRARLQTK